LETKSTFLSEKKWKTIPFSKFPKGAFQQVLDLLLEAPRILARTDQLITLTLEEQLPFALDLLQDCLSVEQKITKTLSQIEAMANGPAFWPIPCSEPESSSEFSKTSYAFPNIRLGVTMVVAWATLTVFWSGLCQLYQLIGFLAPLSPTLDGMLVGQYTVNGVTRPISIPSSERFRQFPMMAQNVCKSVNFCMQDELGLTIMALPLTMVLHGLINWPGFETEIALTKKMLAGFQKKGMNIVQYTYSQ
jgi:hypothetical protein